ncbi:hypothetical protein [Ramlibacter pallidus]|uniref:Uncharacterized protein n=1 Tax=Ramlibacter pallidus TaxID=2780087 RepID=A0ABR9S922_9BURK|nr:hypothetical protein [Ramlibacter pallidus]MBE7370020.1 hypothetical protein [Ramlibacter pallidus]
MNMPRDRKDFPDTEPASLPIAPGEEHLFAETEPQPLMEVAAAPRRQLDLDSLELAPLEITLYDAMVEIRKEHRVCPQPTRWLEFYRVLEHSGGTEPLPAPPLVGSSGASASLSAKRACFSEQVEWAARNGCLGPAFGVLQSLAPSEWQYA